ncbi:MAG: electron transfer flavoprotein subunit beta/FixA family protein [Marinagarivorans sp.]|nr:electron transfer flavoprotein subunit beta/FixA family protein [Marinagarivorans sp.]
MKILVPIKRVVDYNVKVRPNADGSGVDIANAKMSTNPFCEIAVEEAVRLKEQGLATEVIVVSVGDVKCHEQLRAAMALGADRAIHIDAPTTMEPLAIAKALKAIVDKEQPQLIILGKQSIDGDNNQTGQMLAALCGYGQGTFASKLALDKQQVTVTREIDGGLQTLKLTLPAIITTDLRLNEPRYAKLPDIMKAKKKPLETIPATDLGINTQARVQIIKAAAPKTRQAGIIVKSVDELLDNLKNKAKVIA